MTDLPAVRPIRIFISSPGDVAAERDALEDLITNDLQPRLGRHLGVYIEALRWETHGRPGLGDIQSNLFEQLGAYHIYVGIFWRRFGTPTGNHESGSEAEFYDAYERWMADNRRPVMLYFCEREFTVDPRKLTPEQLQEIKAQDEKVEAFRNEVSGKGLFWKYTDLVDFRQHVTRHLNDQIFEIVGTPDRGPAPRPLVGDVRSPEESTREKRRESLPEIDMPPPPAAPYRRLQRFERNDAAVFFGRDRDIVELYQAITSKGPIILFYGDSGVGKSSLLEAGVLRYLETVHQVKMKRRDQPLGLAGTLANLLDVPAEPAAVANAWHALEAKAGKPLTVILDQAEEYVTLPMPAGADTSGGDAPWVVEMRALLAIVERLFAVRANRPGGRLVLSFRKEWLAEITRGLSGVGLPFFPVFLERLDRAGVVEVVRGPATREELREMYRLQIEEKVPEAVADAILDDPRTPAAPVLSILMARMWERAVEKDPVAPTFSTALFEDIRDGEGLGLAEFLSRQLAALRAWDASVVDSGLAIDVLAAHVTDRVTAGAMTDADVERIYPHVRDRVQALRVRCQEMYLLVSYRPDGASVPVTRLAHDTLAPVILQHHKASNAPGQRAQRLLESQAVDWKDGQRGNKLDHVNLKLVEKGAIGMRFLTIDETRLVKASYRRQLWRRLQRLGVAAMISVFALVGVVVLSEIVVPTVAQKLQHCGAAGELDVWCSACKEAEGTWNKELLADQGYCTGSNWMAFDDSAFVEIPAGPFTMGSESGFPDEAPVRDIIVSDTFFMGSTEVTQRQWFAVMGTVPSTYRGFELPVQNVTWFDT
ncbi:MAG: SUMF1/EgtB/PvdO family nonheme iron enzyme [Rhodothermales bacterium]|nr:SUMF1/EgtB/PvdO family nonheme iron enzyme [Rhodothermales bacterium]